MQGKCLISNHLQELFRIKYYFIRFLDNKVNELIARHENIFFVSIFAPKIRKWQKIRGKISISV